MKFHCEHCEQRIDAPDELAGTDADCPACGEAITVPISGSKKQLPVLPEEEQRKLIQQEQLAADMAKEAAEITAEKSKLEAERRIAEEAALSEKTDPTPPPLPPQLPPQPEVYVTHEGKTWGPYDAVTLRCALF